MKAPDRHRKSPERRLAQPLSQVDQPAPSARFREPAARGVLARARGPSPDRSPTTTGSVIAVCIRDMLILDVARLASYARPSAARLSRRG